MNIRQDSPTFWTLLKRAKINYTVGHIGMKIRECATFSDIPVPTTLKRAFKRTPAKSRSPSKDSIDKRRQVLKKLMQT